jgi:uncharacterized protein YcbX
MVKVGRIKELWRYPVKGMAGESIQQCLLTEKGLLGDRIWAVKDTARQEIQSCKFRPELLRCVAQFKHSLKTELGEHVEITLPSGDVINSIDPIINDALTQLTGHESTLEVQRSLDDLDFYRRHKKDESTWLEELKATFEREEGEALPDLDNLPQSAQDFVAVPGTFFLVSSLHFITTATLNHLKQISPDSDWAIERFRPNVVIETEPSFEGLVEQEWINHQLSINGIKIECNGSTPRCGAITKPQQGIESDNRILRTVVKKADQNVGVYGEAHDIGMLAVGDDVYVDWD